ncbi:MAG: FAD-dependent oxidoreductase, partial [Chitinivibrionales bacterium]|nr:FAD-dependent oxidoreductase [Chitinivibrionales bacterium]
MQRKRVAVIGAGIAGLSIGSYLQRNGYDTVVYEMGSMAGGVSVGWRRKGYLFDGATNWLPGSHPPLNLNKIIREVVDYDELEIIDFNEFTRVEHPSGETFTVYKNVDKLRQEMLRIAPEDADVIAEFTTAVGQVRDLR